MTADRDLRVAPSVLAADFARLGAQVREVVDAGASVIHIDVMDGHFVPPLSMGPQVVSALREFDVTLDVHLMVERPELQIGEFARAGADTITIHAEATPHVNYTLAAIRDAGCRAGLAVCPSTPPHFYREVEVDLALCMTVNPGWGGQPFIPSSTDKVRRIAELISDEAELEVDGGIGPATVAGAVRAGARVLVAGSSLFRDAEGLGHAVSDLRARAEAARG